MSPGMRITQQELDPLGAIAARGFVAVGAGAAVLLAVGFTVLHRDDIVSGAAAVLGIVLVLLAGVAAIVGTSPARAPFTAERLGLVVLVGVGAAIAEYVSTVGRNRLAFDDYGAAVVAILLLVLAPYCTWRSLLVTGALASVVLSILVVGGTSVLAPIGPLPAHMLISVAPVLGAAAAASAYAATLGTEVLRRHRATNRTTLGRAGARAGTTAAVLSGEVLPFLAGVMTSDRITVADADRARDLAEALHRALHEGIAATWLDELAAELTEQHGVPVVVDDEASDARNLDDDQRAALTALLSWLTLDDRATAVRVASLREVERGPGEGRPLTGARRRRRLRRFSIEDAPPSHGRLVVAALPGANPPSRRDLRRFAALARAFGMGARVSATRDNAMVELRHVIE